MVTKPASQTREALDNVFWGWGGSLMPRCQLRFKYHPLSLILTFSRMTEFPELAVENAKPGE